MDLELKQLIDIDDNTLNTITTWIYNWWGKDMGYTFAGVKCYILHSLQEDRLPQTYGLFLGGNIIGMFQITYEDLEVRPDIYPWIANVYIDKKYRNMGYGRRMLQDVKNIAINKTDYKQLFLYTKHIGLFEKFGWKFVSLIDTHMEESRMERLYKLDLE